METKKYSEEWFESLAMKICLVALAVIVACVAALVVRATIDAIIH